MNVRNLVRKEIKNILNESQNIMKVLPKNFDHLKWKLNRNQKYYLQELCEVNPETLSELDFMNASKFLEIPLSNVKSIINTYSEFKLEEAKTEQPSSLEKVITARDVEWDYKYRQPERLPSSSFNISKERDALNKSNMMSPAERNTVGFARMKDRVLDTSGKYKEKELYYENLKTSLMMYLFCEIKPKNIGLSHNGKIQLDQEPQLLENETFSMENQTYRNVKKLIKSFNKIFNCNFRISEHLELTKKENCHRTIIELFGIASDKWFWSGETWIKPGQEGYEQLRERYIDNDGQQARMPEVPHISHQELLSKYFNGELISYNPNADWLL